MATLLLPRVMLPSNNKLIRDSDIHLWLNMNVHDLTSMYRIKSQSTDNLITHIMMKNSIQVVQ